MTIACKCDQSGKNIFTK